MNTEQLQAIAVAALNDLKAIDLVVLDVRELTTITDVMIICSGRSTRHVMSLAENVIKLAKQQQVSYVRLEADKASEWVIVDLADVIVHILLPATRAFYRLEDLWEPIKTSRENHAHSPDHHRE
jgi:ribosome-associated protein